MKRIPNKISKKSLEKFIASTEPKEISKIVIDICNKFPEVAQYFNYVVFKQNSEDCYKEYSKSLEKLLNPGSNFNRLQEKEAVILVHKFEKVSIDKIQVVDLKFKFIDICFDLIEEWGDFDNSFVNKIIKMFESALETIVSNCLEEACFEKVERIMERSENIPYGIGLVFDDIYRYFFN